MELILDEKLPPDARTLKRLCLKYAKEYFADQPSLMETVTMLLDPRCKNLAELGVSPFLVRLLSLCLSVSQVFVCFSTLKHVFIF